MYTAFIRVSSSSVFHKDYECYKKSNFLYISMVCVGVKLYHRPTQHMQFFQGLIFYLKQAQICYFHNPPDKYKYVLIYSNHRNKVCLQLRWIWRKQMLQIGSVIFLGVIKWHLWLLNVLVKSCHTLRGEKFWIKIK